MVGEGVTIITIKSERMIETKGRKGLRGERVRMAGEAESEEKK